MLLLELWLPLRRVVMKPSVEVLKVILSPSTNSGNVQWYGAATGGSVLSTGDNFSPGNSTSYILLPHLQGCPSSRTGITATVNANPTPSASAKVRLVFVVAEKV